MPTVAYLFFLMDLGAPLLASETSSTGVACAKTARRARGFYDYNP